MTKFIQLNFAEYNLNQDFLKIAPMRSTLCVCCLDQNGPFLNLGKCAHTQFFEDIGECKLNMSEMAACVICHRMLAKIDIFKKQVKESLQKLSEQAEHLTPNRKINNLTLTAISSCDTTATLNSNTDELEHKIEATNTDTFFETEVKIEFEQDFPGISDDDTSIPLSEIKKTMSRKKKKVKRSSIKIQKEKKNSKSMLFKKKYKGKISIATLTPAQLALERESDRLKETYMKLPYKCEECIRGFDHEATMLEHRDKHHTYREGKLQCDICKCYMSTDASLKEHFRRHFKRYECVKCNKRTNTLQPIIAHYNESHGAIDDVIDTYYTCHDCGLSLASNRAYRYHLEKHKPKEQCSECEKTFVNRHGLKIHMLTIHKKSSRRYTCEPCNKVYKAKSGLLLHIAAHHRTGSQAYCMPCRTHFKTESILRHHLRTHSKHVTDGDKKFVCCECGDRFLTQPALNEHTDWVHLKKAQHSCTKCDKVFKNKSALRRHSSFVHDKKRPPRNKICDHCGRGFTTLQILRSHVRTHTGERPLKCTHCDATFAHPSALYTHNKLIHASQSRATATAL